MANEPLGPRYHLNPPNAPILLPHETFLEYRDRVANEIIQYNEGFRRWRRRSQAARERYPFRWRRPLRGIYPEIPPLIPGFLPHAPQNWRHRLGINIAAARRAGANARRANQRRSLTGFLALRNAGRSTAANGFIAQELQDRIASFL